MNFKKVLVGGAILYLVYKTGVLKGHCECLRNIQKKCSGDIFNENGEFVDKVSKNVSIVLKKKNP